jgi:hypothetical protein
LNKKWLPGILGGKAVTVIYEMPVIFQLG